MTESTIIDPLDRIKNQELSLRDVYYVLFRYKWRIILTFLVLTSIVVAFASSRPVMYQSAAKLMVQLGRESVTLDPVATTGKIVNVSQSRKNEINSELEILGSRDLLEGVVDDVGPPEILKGLDEKFPLTNANLTPIKKANLERRSTPTGQADSGSRLTTRERAIGVLFKGLQIEVLKDSNIIRVAYKANRPEHAQLVLSKLIDFYLEKHIAVHRIAGSYEFFVEQSGHLRNELSELEDEIRFLKTKTGIASPEEYRGMHLQRIVRMEEELEQTDTDLAYSVAKVAELKKILDSLPERAVRDETAGHRNSTADRLRERLYELQLEERELLSKFEEESRNVQVVRQQLSEVQTLLQQQQPSKNIVTTGPNPTYQNLHLALLTESAAVSALQAKANALKTKLQEAQKRLETLTADEVEISRLLREVDIRETSYRKYSENLEQVRIDHALESEKISNISVVQPATLPALPIGNSKLVIYVLGFILSILGTASVALYSAYFDHSVMTPEQVAQRLELPTLTSIPRALPASVSPVKKHVGKSRRTKNNGAVTLTQWSIPDQIKDNYTLICEHLHRRIQEDSPQLQVIAVTSCGRREGSSTVAANLAAALASQNEGQVLLVDTDVSRPSIHQIFKASLSPGLTDFLVNGQVSQEQLNGNLIQTAPVGNLSVLAAGIPKWEKSESFNVEKFFRRLALIKDQYRFVVLDLPALDDMSSAVGLACLCDGVVLVVESERLRWEAIKSHKDSLVNANANILGVVLNKRRFPIPEWLYETL